MSSSLLDTMSRHNVGQSCSSNYCHHHGLNYYPLLQTVHVNVLAMVYLPITNLEIASSSSVDSYNVHDYEDMKDLVTDCFGR